MSYLSSKSVRTLKKALSVTLAVTTIVLVSGIFSITPLLAAVTVNEGDIIRGPDGIKVYIVNEHGYKRHIFNPDVFNMYGHLSWANIKEVDQATLDSYQTSDLYKAAGHEEIYSLEESGTGAIKHWITTWADFTGLGYVMNQVFIINDNEIAYTGYTTGSDLVYTAPAPSGLSVALATDNPAASTLIGGQAIADLAHYTFSGSGTITNIVLKRIGISANTTLSNVYLFDGNVRLTDAATVASDGTITFNNSGGLFTVATAKTISVRSDIAVVAGETVGTSLVSATYGTTAVSGTLPVNGNLHSIATATLAGVAFAAATGSGNTDPGNDITLWQSTATIGTRDVTLTRLALRQVGSINSADINTFRLLADGVEVAAATGLDSNGYVTFSLNKILSTGGRVLKVIGNVIGGSNRTVQMSLRGVYDVTAIDSQYNANILSTGTFPVGPAAFTVNAGTMTVVKAADSQSNPVTIGASDVSVAKYTLTAYGETIKVETLRVGMITTGGTVTDHTLRNVRLLVNGSQVGSTTHVPAAAAFAAASGTSFTTNFMVVPGTPATVEIRTDIFDNEGTNDIATPGATALQTLLVGGAATSNAVPQVSLGFINVPSQTNVLGNVLSIASGSISLAQQTTYTAQTMVVPQTAYKIGAFNLIGNSTEAVNLNTLEVDLTSVTGTTLDGSDDLTDLYVKYGTSTTSVKGTAADTDNTWSISRTLAVNETLPIEVYATIGSVVTAGDSIRADFTVTGITAGSSITVYADVTSTNTTKDAGFQGQVITGGTGSITMSLNAGTPAAALIDDNTSLINVATLTFTTVNDGYTITDLVLTIPDASTISTVNLYDDSGLITGGSKPGATTLTYAGLSWPVGANASKNIYVKLSLGTVGVGAGTSAAQVTVTATSAIARNSGGTSAAVTESPSNPVGSVSYVYKAVPTITNGTLTTSILNVGTQEISRFSISSGGSGTISWGKLAFTVTKSLGGADSLATPTLWDADSNTQIAGTAIFTGSIEADGDAAGGIEFIPSVEQQISGAKTYKLMVTIAAAALATGDNITVQIAQPSAFAASAAAYAANTASSINYYDVGNSATITAGDYRHTAGQLNYSSAYGQVNAGVATFLTADTTDEVLSYGTFTTGATIILTETGAATNTIGAITGTLVSTDLYTCTARDAANGAGSATVTVASILSILCTKTGSQIILNTAAIAPDAGVSVTTITLTLGTAFAAGSLVAAADSDLGLTLVASVLSGASFVWSDVSAQAHSLITTDWTNGYLVKNLPTATQILSK